MLPLDDKIIDACWVGIPKILLLVSSDIVGIIVACSMVKLVDFVWLLASKSIV